MAGSRRRRGRPTARPRPCRRSRPRRARAAEPRRTAPGAGNFIRESIGELRKVEWPTQNQLVQGTVVVIVACVIIGTYLYFADLVFNKLVSKLLLGQ